MAEKKPQIVIKKITVVQGGGHGGAWKVAFADFMTAMMAFFLVMWLISSASEEEKKAISDYFSTPSVIEYQFQNYGAEMTLEKLFLDLVNEPLKTLASLVEPADRTPNVMHLGTKKIVMSYMAEQLGSMASDVAVTADSITFEIPDNLLFRSGSADPSLQFVNVMERVKGVTEGLEDSEIVVSSVVYREFVKSKDMTAAKLISDQRLDLLIDKVKSGLKNESVMVSGSAVAKDDDRGPHDTRPGGGYVKFEIRQKSVLPDGRKPSKFSAVGGAKGDKSDYDQIVKEVSERESKHPKAAAPAARPSGDAHKKGIFSELPFKKPSRDSGSAAGAGGSSAAGSGGASGAPADDVAAEANSEFPTRARANDGE